jgi:NAD(P)-dependent dehydrogenase (short-subunit alcohol dehydrogenase family)
MPVAVVTGAASGIGRALATQLAARGYDVHLADVSPTAELAEALGGVSAEVDVSKPDEVARLAESAPDAEIVCLNAGVVGAALGAPWEVPPEEWLRLLGVNLLGVVNGLRAFVPRMLESGRPGRIVITGSLAGLVTFPGGGAYAATKHAVVAVAEQAAMLLAGTKVSVTLTCPALVRSGMSEVGDDPDGVAATVLDAAAAGRFLVVPQEWASAVVVRTDRLVSGGLPEVPSPGEAGSSADGLGLGGQG